ncbi:DUF6526 family protein [Brevibacillus ginsengisoli]|uniref:DUF6526 family protein n=1 Tax=Brevibacillus ginsengisoli TaxID=363854 RepID=UPI003CEC1B2D
MNTQNYQNHRRLHPIFHYVSLPLLLVTLVGSLILLIKEGFSLASFLILVIAFLLFIAFFLLRTYSLKAQDRAIRAEENLRHYVLNGQLLDSRLTLAQIVALRFASDAELVELSQQAVAKKLSSDDIKKAIKNWKADHNRI